MIRFNSSPRNVSRIEPYIDKIVDRFKVSPESYGNILISLTEAVTNAMRHGNRNDENKLVRVDCRKQQDTICFEVSDEGKGFDYNNLPDPTHPDNICKCGGRGVFLMRELADDIEFHDNGSTIKMHFRI
jgi:serine/threonine-protein kinase RsbW